MENVPAYVKNYAKMIAFRMAGPTDDKHELVADLTQDGFLAVAKCPPHYAWPQIKVAVRYSIMCAMVRWRWQVQYHGKNYVPRDDMYQCEDCDTIETMAFNPEDWAIAREEVRHRWK